MWRPFLGPNLAAVQGRIRTFVMSCWGQSWLNFLLGEMGLSGEAGGRLLADQQGAQATLGGEFC